MQIDKITAIDSEIQLVHVTITHGSDKYKYDMNTPVLEGDALQAHCDAKEFKSLNNILYQVYDRNIQFSSEAEWDEWIADGCKIPEVSQEIPAIKKKAAVYEDVEVEPAVEAKDAVMGERHKEIEKEVDKSEVKVVKEGDKYVQKTVVSKEVVKESVYEEVPLYGEDGEKVKRLVSEAVEAAPSVKYEEGDVIPEGKKVGMVKIPAVKAKAAVYEDVKHSIPVMEEYEVEPAVEAKDAVTEKRLVSEAVKAVAKKTLVIKPEATIEKKAWVDSH
jgi:hypothetical protein